MPFTKILNDYKKPLFLIIVFMDYFSLFLLVFFMTVMDD